jgi:hypothetical protein
MSQRKGGADFRTSVKMRHSFGRRFVIFNYLVKN